MNRIVLLVDDALKAKLERVSKMYGLAMSTFIRQFLMQKLREAEKVRGKEL